MVKCVDSLKMHALGLNQAEQDREIGLGLQVEALGHGHDGACRHAAGRACGTGGKAVARRRGEAKQGTERGERGQDPMGHNSISLKVSEIRRSSEGTTMAWI